MESIRYKKKYISYRRKRQIFFNSEKVFYLCKIGKKTFYPKYYNDSRDLYTTMYGIINKGRFVVFEIHLEHPNNLILKFFISYNNFESEIFPSLGNFTHLPNIFYGYYNSGDYMIKLIENRIHIYEYNKKLEEAFEKEYCEELKARKKHNIIRYRNKYIKYRKNMKEKRKEIWIINDKQYKAGDNGEYFFRYLKKIKPKRINYYFRINRKCFDYKRLEYLGNILQ